MKGQNSATLQDDEWRVGHVGRDAMYYEEFHAGVWRRLSLDGELLMGRAHHVIYFGTLDSWKNQPDWAQGRRDIIIDRVKSVFQMPDYRFDGEEILDKNDVEMLIEMAGGISDQTCVWAGCKERALKQIRICVHHAFNSQRRP